MTLNFDRSSTLNNCADLPSNDSNDSLNNEMEVNDSDCNSGNANGISECEIVKGNSNNNNRIVNSNDNGNTESNISSNSKMNITETSDSSSDSDSEDGEICSDASIGGGPSGDESSLDFVHSTDHDGFVVPLPVKWTTQKPPVVASPARPRSVSPAGKGRSRSPLVSGKHPLPPAAPSRPKSQRSWVVSLLPFLIQLKRFNYQRQQPAYGRQVC